MSCGDDSLDPLDPKQFHLNTYLNGYHAKNFPTQKLERFGNPSVYLDLSSGLSWGFKDGHVNQDIVKQMAGVLEQGHSWYKVQNSNIIPFPDGRYDLYNMVTDPNSFSEIYAPIGETLDSIVASKNDALFVTDFEEYMKTDGSYTNNEQKKPYLMEPIKKWLLDGNSFTIIHGDPYIEKESIRNAEKLIHFAVFNFGTEKLMLSKIKTALDTRGINYKEFSMDLSTFNAQIKK